MAASRITKKQAHTLKLLEKLAKRVGLRVSYGKLQYAGLKLKGGQCLFRGEKWLIIDRRHSFDDQVDLFRDALREYDLSQEDVPREIHGLLMDLIQPPAAAPAVNPPVNSRENQA